MTIIVTNHACKRWRDRIDPLATDAEAREAILRWAPAIKVAATSGCNTVRTAAATLILDGWTVTTVLPRRGFRSARA